MTIVIAINSTIESSSDCLSRHLMMMRMVCKSIVWHRSYIIFRYLSK